MKPSITAVSLITRFEGLKLDAYVCPAGKITIGAGTTIYPNDTAVKMGDKCTKEQAQGYLMHDLERRAKAIGDLPVNQNQYDAIISFVYNVGIANWNNSTLRKLVKANPKDEDIYNEFLKWNKLRSKGKMVVSNGLTNRRVAEATLYNKHI